MSEPTHYTRRALRVSINAVYAVPTNRTSEEAASDLWDAIFDALDNVPGMFVQSGSTVEMPVGDVVRDSPLDREMRS